MVVSLSSISTLVKLARTSSLLRSRVDKRLARDVRVERELGVLVLKSALGAKIAAPPAERLLSILGRAGRVDMGAGLSADDRELFRLAKPRASRWLCMGDAATGSSPTTVLVVSHVGHGQQTIDLRATQRLVVSMQPPALFGLRQDTDTIRPAAGRTFLGPLPRQIVLLPEPPRQHSRDPAATVALCYTSALYFFLSSVTEATDADVQVVGLSPPMMAAAKLTFDGLRTHFEAVVEQIEHEIDFLGPPAQTEGLLDMLAKVKLVPWEQYQAGLDESQFAFETRYCVKCLGYGPGMCEGCKDAAGVSPEKQ